MQREDVILGIHAITEAVVSGKRSISKLWIRDGLVHHRLRALLRLADAQAIPCSRVPLVKLRRLVGGRHQGAVAFLAPVPFVAVDDVVQMAYERGEPPCVLLLDRVQDVGNVGAMARTALATGVDALVVGGGSSAPVNRTVMRRSAGALAHLPICRTRDLAQTLRFLRHHGLRVMACTEKATSSLYATDLTGPIALLLGGEAQGIADRHLQEVDAQVAIPMVGPVASLNVSVAAAVVLYERVRQRQL